MHFYYSYSQEVACKFVKNVCQSNFVQLSTKDSFSFQKIADERQDLCQDWCEVCGVVFEIIKQKILVQLYKISLNR